MPLNPTNFPQGPSFNAALQGAVTNIETGAKDRVALAASGVYKLPFLWSAARGGSVKLIDDGGNEATVYLTSAQATPTAISAVVNNHGSMYVSGVAGSGQVGVTFASHQIVLTADSALVGTPIYLTADTKYIPL